MNDWHRIDLTIYAVTDDSEELEVIADAAMQYIRDKTTPCTTSHAT